MSSHNLHHASLQNLARVAPRRMILSILLILQVLILFLLLVGNRIYSSAGGTHSATGLLILAGSLLLTLGLHVLETRVTDLAYRQALSEKNELQIQISSLEVREAERNRALTTSADVSRRISTILDQKQLVTEVVELIRVAFNYYHAQIYFVDEGGDHLVLAGGTGQASQTMLENRHTIPFGRGLVGRAAQANQVILISNVQKDYNWLPNPLLPETKAEAAVPIAIGDSVLGVLDVQHNIVDGLKQEDADLLHSIARQIAVALQNARSFEEIQRGRQQLQTIVEATASKTGEQFFLSLISHLAETLNMQHGFIARLDAANNRVQTLALWVNNAPAENYSYSLEGTPCQNVIDGALCMYPQNVQQLFPKDLDLVSLQAQSYLGIPLYSTTGEVLGHLAVLDTEPMHDIERRKSLLQIFAARAGAELERQLVQDALTKRAGELETVAAVSTTASKVLDPDELLTSVVDLTRERFNLYHAHVYIVDETHQTLALAAGAGEVGRQMAKSSHAIPLLAEKSLVARAARERSAVIVNDVRNEPDFLANELLPETRAEMAVPMIVGDALIGVFDVQSNVVAQFTKEDINIYTTLAAQVAISLQNARLYVEQAATVEQLRELDHLKSSFLANMSHELRTPLNSILGFADVMLQGLDGPLTDMMTNDLGLIEKNGKHLLHLINDVLDMAKIDSGKMNIDIEKFNVYELLTEVTDITSSLAKDKSIELVIDPESDREVEIEADKVRIRQVIINLVNNAMKFTDKGSVSLGVARRHDKVLILVKDTGIGIPASHLDSVFQEFTQVDTSATRKAGGTGLGLPISRRLVNLHGGHLWAESAGIPGKGSTFHVELPLESNLMEKVGQ